MARAAANGAALDCAVRLVAAQDVCADDVLGAGGALFVCPENLGTMSGMMKDMFDRLYYPLLGLIEGRAYATAIAAGSDGSGAQAQIDRIVKGWRLRRVAALAERAHAGRAPAKRVHNLGELREGGHVGREAARGLRRANERRVVRGHIGGRQPRSALGSGSSGSC